MKKLVFCIIVSGLLGCSPDKEVVEVIKGDKGDAGISCLVEETETGLNLTCANGTFSIVNGIDGRDGSDGLDGRDGVDGTDGEQGPAGPTLGELSQITLSGCTLVETGLYAKLGGSGSLKLYNNSSCHGSGLETLSSTDELYILSGGNLLLFQSDLNILYKLTFN